MEAVARNIYQFFHVILVKAHDEPLWTRNSLQRSIQWAKYCEKVHHEAISKGHASYVAMLLKDMSRLTPDRRAVNFDDLKLSSQLLVAELLQCPLLRKGTVQIILESELAQEPWLEVMCEIFVINSILKDLVEEKEDNQPKCGGEFGMLTEKLCGLSGSALDMQLDLLARKSPETLLKLASCEDDRYSALACCTGLWTARRLAVGDDSVSASVWTQESGLLCKAACRSPSLMQCLLQRLQEHAESMEPCFTAGADEWVLTRFSTQAVANLEQQRPTSNRLFSVHSDCYSDFPVADVACYRNLSEYMLERAVLARSKYRSRVLLQQEYIKGCGTWSMSKTFCKQSFVKLYLTFIIS